MQISQLQLDVLGSVSYEDAILGADGREFPAIMHGESRDGEELWETSAL